MTSNKDYITEIVLELLLGAVILAGDSSDFRGRNF